MKSLAYSYMNSINTILFTYKHYFTGKLNHKKMLMLSAFFIRKTSLISFIVFKLNAM